MRFDALLLPLLYRRVARDQALGLNDAIALDQPLIILQSSKALTEGDTYWGRIQMDSSILGAGGAVHLGWNSRSW